MKFRLLLCAILVFALAAVALLTTKKGYTSSATVWAEQPLYYKDQTNLNPYISVADNQVSAFQELMATRQFCLNILTQAGRQLNSAGAQDTAINQLRQNLLVESAGPHLIRITYTNDAPAGVEEVVTQSVKLFINYMSTDRVRQANLALSLYQQQLGDYEQQMNQSVDALNTYLQQHPEALVAGASPGPVLSDLQQQVFDNRSRYNDLKNTISNIQAQSQAAPDVSSEFFQLIDAPQAATPYQLTSKDLLKNGLIALALSLFSVLALVLVGTWTDPAVYTANDIRLLLPEEDETSQDLLVVTIPYVQRLASIRRAAQREALTIAKVTGRQKTSPTAEARTAAKSA
jgi:uncharacterized protein involved in exopolysaccharide biosynthesis